MMEEIDRFQVPTAHSEMQPLDPAAASISDGDCDAREGESVAMNYKPSPLQVKLEKQRELARKGSLKNGSMGSPVNQQPKKNNVMARTRLVVPNKGYSSLDQSPDEKPLVALDTDSDDDFDMSRYSSSGYSSAEQINQDLNIQLLKDGYRTCTSVCSWSRRNQNQVSLHPGAEEGWGRLFSYLGESHPAPCPASQG
uniref:Family with sequence similarity 219 member A n=1 Tax=Callithrix jacchus TaxID=9483 RepID=A0A8J8YGD4_CALJA